MPEIFPTSGPEPTSLESHTAKIMGGVNDALKSVVATHIRQYLWFWSSQHTPADILAEMGTNATKWLMTAGQSVAHMEALAGIAGLTIDEVLPPKYNAPQLPFVLHEDGTVTVESVEGLDEWGNTIVEEEEVV